MEDSRYQVWILASHTAFGLVVIIAATVLGAIHILNGEAVTAVYGAALGFAGGAANSAAVAGQLTQGKTLVRTERLQELREAADENGLATTQADA